MEFDIKAEAPEEGRSIRGSKDCLKNLLVNLASQEGHNLKNLPESQGFLDTAQDEEGDREQILEESLAGRSWLRTSTPDWRGRGRPYKNRLSSGVSCRPRESCGEKRGFLKAFAFQATFSLPIPGGCRGELGWNVGHLLK